VSLARVVFAAEQDDHGETTLYDVDLDGADAPRPIIARAASVFLSSRRDVIVYARSPGAVVPYRPEIHVARLAASSRPGGS
jgi:hypothetical protein